MMRTIIVMDDDLMRRAMEVSGAKTKKEIVEQAVLEFVTKRTRKDLRDLIGKTQYAEGYDYKALREGR